jgi:hypothetical protein
VRRLKKAQASPVYICRFKGWSEMLSYSATIFPGIICRVSLLSGSAASTYVPSGRCVRGIQREYAEHLGRFGDGEVGFLFGGHGDDISSLWDPNVFIDPVFA